MWGSQKGLGPGNKPASGGRARCPGPSEATQARRAGSSGTAAVGHTWLQGRPRSAAQRGAPQTGLAGRLPADLQHGFSTELLQAGKERGSRSLSERCFLERSSLKPSATPKGRDLRWQSSPCTPRSRKSPLQTRSLLASAVRSRVGQRTDARAGPRPPYALLASHISTGFRVFPCRLPKCSRSGALSPRPLPRPPSRALAERQGGGHGRAASRQ